MCSGLTLMVYAWFKSLIKRLTLLPGLKLLIALTASRKDCCRIISPCDVFVCVIDVAAVVA